MVCVYTAWLQANLVNYEILLYMFNAYSVFYTDTLLQLGFPQFICSGLFVYKDLCLDSSVTSL